MGGEKESDQAQARGGWNKADGSDDDDIFRNPGSDYRAGDWR